MSIEKFSGKMNKEDLGCTIIVNETIQSITDHKLLGLYVYLLTKPNDWVIHYKEIMNHFSISKDMAYKLINGLIGIGLLSRIAKRDQGRFSSWEYVLHLKKTDVTPFPENHELVSAISGFQGNIQNKELIQNKDNKKTVISESKDSAATATSKALKEKEKKEFKKQLIHEYHDVFPDNPKHMVEYIAKDLDTALNIFIEKYPCFNKNKEPLTVALFRQYLLKLKNTYPAWTMESYKTPSGRSKTNSLVTFVRMENVGKVLEGRMQ